jgi:hypothetical protein
METMREAWTDERLDDLNHRVDEGFKEMREEFRAVRADLGAEIGGVRLELGAEIGSVRSELSGQIAQLHRTILQLFGGMMATIVVGFLAILTQL